MPRQSRRLLLALIPLLLIGLVAVYLALRLAPQSFEATKAAGPAHEGNAGIGEPFRLPSAVTITR
jgi:hypothetical protein